MVGEKVPAHRPRSGLRLIKSLPGRLGAAHTAPHPVPPCSPPSPAIRTLVLAVSVPGLSFLCPRLGGELGMKLLHIPGPGPPLAEKCSAPHQPCQCMVPASGAGHGKQVSCADTEDAILGTAQAVTKAPVSRGRRQRSQLQKRITLSRGHLSRPAFEGGRCLPGSRSSPGEGGGETPPVSGFTF